MKREKKKSKSLAEMKQELKDTVKRQLWTEVETEQKYGSEKEDLHLLEIIPSTLLPRLHKGERTD